MAMKQLTGILLLGMLCLLFSCSAVAQKEVVLLWPQQIPCPNEHEEVVENDKEIGRLIKKVHAPSIEVFLAPDSIANGTGVLICPGGGYFLLAWDWEGIQMAEWLNENGIHAFVLKNRLPHWENENCRDKVALMDVQKAMRIIRHRNDLDDWQLNRVGVMGFSAGGHLAASLLVHHDVGKEKEKRVEGFSCRPDFGVLMYPVISMDTTITHMGSRENLLGKKPDAEQVLFHSTEKQVTADTPPTILIHAGNDDAVYPENSIRFYQALCRSKVPAALHIYKDGEHGFAFGKAGWDVYGWPKVCLDWIDGVEK